MKRLFVLGLVLAILAVGFTAFADPIVVGGSHLMGGDSSEMPSTESLRPGNAYGILNRLRFGNADGIDKHWGG